MTSRILGWTAASLIAACAMPRVPVQGPRAAVSHLEGEWVGAYSSVETGRHGDIGFYLKAGADSAWGYVYMIPHADHPQLVALEEPFDPDLDVQQWGQGLSITLVQVQVDRVSGALDPYRDPVCGCWLQTVFRGQMRADSITGSYESRHLETGPHHQPGIIHGGEWWVTRKRSQ